MESDPAVLNLTAFESVLRRAAAVLRGRARAVPLRRELQRRSTTAAPARGCSTAAASGARPQLAGTYGDTTPQQPTTILGAGKLTGRLPGGLTLGVLDADTQRATGPGRHRPSSRAPTSRVLRAQAGPARRQQQHRRDAHGGEPQPRRVERPRTWPRSAYVGRRRLPPPVPQEQLRGLGVVRRGAAWRAAAAAILGHPDRRGALLPAARRRAAARLRPAPRSAGDAEEFNFAQGGRPAPDVPDGVPAALGRLRDQRPRLPAARRPADRGAPGRGTSTATSAKLYNRFQWNNNWWQYWTTGGPAAGGGLQHQHPRHVPEQLVVPPRRRRSASSAPRTTTAPRAAARPSGRTRTSRRGWGSTATTGKPLVPYVWVNYLRGDAGHSTQPEPQPRAGLQGGVAVQLRAVGELVAQLATTPSGTATSRTRRRRRTTPSRTWSRPRWA